ncbi:MAG: hypothetical protein QW815_08470 [Nitrososphaerota archaeon]
MQNSGIAFRKFSVILLTATMILLTFSALPTQVVLAQPQPPSPEEEWYPPEPYGSADLPTGMQMIVTPGPGPVTALTARLLDLSLNVRRELYRGDGFFLEFSTNFPSFWIWCYEWYPPGNQPSGHWLIWAAGPFTGGGTYRIGIFLPEPTEPEGRHTWKIWLWNPTRGWATAILRFDFWEHPRPRIERVDVAPNMKRNSPHTVSVVISNTGEKQQAYVVSLEGTGFTINPSSSTTIVNPGATATVQFQVIPTLSGQLSLTAKVMADSRIYDSKTFGINVRTPLPSHRLDIFGLPSEVKIGEIVPITVSFANTGEGVAQQVGIRITSAEGVSVIKGSDTVSQVQPGASYTLSLQVRPETGGVRTITLRLEYMDEEGKRYSDEYMISLKVLVPVKVSAMIERKNQPLTVQFTISGTPYTGIAEKWVTSDPVQLTMPQEWKVSDDIVAEFVRWSDGDTAPSRTIQAFLPTELRAEYRLKYRVKVTADRGSPTGTGWYYDGTSLSLMVEEIIQEKDRNTRYIFLEWSDGIKEARRHVTITAPTQYHAKYKTQYYLDVVSEFGMALGAGWYDAGTLVLVSIDKTEIDVGFPYVMVFKGWSGDIVSGPQPVQIVMNGPKSLKAVWERQINQLLYLIVGIIAVVAVGVFLVLRRPILRRIKSKARVEKTNSPSKPSFFSGQT